MNKNILFSSILGLLIILSAFWVTGVVTFAQSNPISNISFTDWDGTPEISNWTKNNQQVTINVTLNLTSEDGQFAAVGNNVTEINITLMWSEVPFNLTMMAGNFSSFRVAQTSVINASDVNCRNTTVGFGMYCVNKTKSSPIAPNDTIQLSFNITMVTSNIEKRLAWNISIIANKTLNSSIFNGTGADDLEPRLGQINVTCVLEGTGAETEGLLLTTRQADLNGTAYCGNGTKLNVSLLLEDYNRGNANQKIYWNITRTPTVPDIFYEANNADNSLILTASAACVSDQITSCVYSAIIESGNLSDGETLSFVIVANDSFNHQFNHSNNGLGFNITVDSTAPLITDINISDCGINSSSRVNDVCTTLTSFDNDFNSTNYLMNGSTINVTIIVKEYNRQNGEVIMFYNVSAPVTVPGGSTESLKKVFLNSSMNAIGNGTVNMSTACSDTEVRGTTQSCLYSGIIYMGNFSAREGQYVSVGFFMNDSFNHSNNYTHGAADGVGVGYNFTLDGRIPAAAITMPSSTTIDALRSITIKCEGSDTQSSVKTTEIKITKSDGTTITKSVDSSNEATFKNTDTNRAGKYNVDCTVEDYVGLKGYATQQTFRVFATGTGMGVAAAPAVVFDADFTEVVEKSFKRNEGSSVTFSFDGLTEHKITWKKVEANKVTLVIESDPIEITLAVGDTKNIDINNDGINDVSVALDEIDENKAKVTVRKLEGADVVAEEEKKAAEEREEIPPVTPPTALSRKGLWITIIVIVVILVIGYLVVKGKGKKGQIRFSREELRGKEI